MATDVVIETPRDVLSAITRRAAPRIIARIAEEAARSAHAGPEDVAAYARWMDGIAGVVLDAIAADDAQRVRLLAAFAEVEVGAVRPVPPVARVGLLEIAIRLMQDELASETASRADAALVQAELGRFSVDLRTALREAGALPSGSGR